MPPALLCRKARLIASAVPLGDRTERRRTLGRYVKHPASRALYEYWDKQRGGRPAPERGEIEPGAIRTALGDSFVLAYDRVGGHPFRLAGTRLCGLFARELKSEGFNVLWRSLDRASASHLVETVANDLVGLVAGAEGRTAEGYSVELELLLLPLRLRGNPHARQIGTLAPLAVPYWLGSSPVTELTLGTHRHLGAAAKSVVVTPFMAGADTGRSRRGLVVYDGGRT